MRKEYLSVKEIARVLHISRNTVYRLMGEGKLTPVVQPLYLRAPHKIPRAEVESLIATLPEPDRTAALSRLHGKQP